MSGFEELKTDIIEHNYRVSETKRRYFRDIIRYVRIWKWLRARKQSSLPLP